MSDPGLLMAGLIVLPLSWGSLAFLLGPGRLLAEVGYTRADLSESSLQGSISGFFALLGYRFDM